MKHYIILLLFLTIIMSCSNTTKLQTEAYKTNIKTDFTEYINLVKNQAFEKSMDYLYEPFFEIMPKEKVIEMLERTFNDTAISISFGASEILNVKNYKKINEEFYSLLSYSSITNMKFNTEMKNEFMLHAYQLQFGKKNVKYNNSTNTYEIYVEKKVYAISDNGKTNWTFLTINKYQKDLLRKLLPKQIVNSI